MHKLIIMAMASLFAANVAFAQAAAPTAAPGVAKPAAAAAPAKVEEKKADAAKDASGCEGKAVGKNGKPLAGAAKTAFMKKCEKDGKGADKAAGKTSQQEKMKSCNKEAGEKQLKGKDRKEFMSGCLKKG